ncbi:MAG: AraC family transcriptional regulator [Acidobacteriota bacterium]
MLPTYASSYVRHVLSVAAGLGADRHVLLDHASLREAELQSPSHRVSQPQVLCLYQAGALLTGQASLGLSVGESVRPEGLHQLGYALMSCETVGEALSLNLRFQPLVMGQGQFDTHLTDDTVTLSWRPAGASPALLRPINESILASWVRFGQWITGSAATPLRVTFCHARPSDLSAYHRIFQCPLHFDGPTNSLTGPRHLLDLPIRQANPGLKQALLSAMEAQLLPQGLPALSTPQEIDWLLQVRQALLATLDQPGQHLPHVAASLGTSERTLKRRLAAHGTSLRELLQDVRMNHALQRLQSPQVSVDQLARELGYRSASAFSLAFKKWQGTAPSKLRRRSPR